MTLDPELQRLLASAREADLPDEARLLRVQDELFARLAPLGTEAAASAKTAVAAKTVATGAGGLAVKAVGLVSALGLAVWSVQHLSQRDAKEASPVAPPVAAPAPAAPATPFPPALEVAGAAAPLPPTAAGAPALDARSVPEPAPAPTRRARAQKRSAVRERSRAAPDERPNDFAGELSLLQRALQAQRSGRIDEARALVAEHARRYPSGALRTERERLAAQLAASSAPD
jgi:hypothetical protein